MLSVPVSLGQVTVVLKGNLNPSIFSPAWLLSQGVVGNAEYEEAEIEVISRDITSFKCAWIDLFASVDTLQLSTRVDAEFERLRDAAIAILRSLPHTPIAVLGINRIVHFRVESTEAAHRIGDTLVPKEPWRDVLEFPGMRAVTVWGVRPGTQAGRVQVTVEPSNAIPNGVFVAHNDHYELTERESHPSGRDEGWLLGDQAPVEATSDKLPLAVGLLADDWKNSMNRAEAVIQRVYEQATV